MTKSLILVVEDDVPIRNLICTTLKAHNYRYVTAEKGETAILEASSHNRRLSFWTWACRISTASRSSAKSAPGLRCPLS